MPWFRSYSGDVILSTLIGLIPVAVIALLAWLVLATSRSSSEIAISMRALGSLSALVSGTISALWWHQSADLSERSAVQAGSVQQDANILNGAAATSTGLALISGVFTTVPWPSLESGLAAGSFLLLLVISSWEVGHATRISWKQKLTIRVMFVRLVMVVAIIVFLYRLNLP